MKNENIYKIAPIFISVFVFCFAIAFYALGWTEPTVAPPGGTVNVPINVGNIGQSKAGGLILNTGGAANGLIVQSGFVGIGTTSPVGKLDVRGGAVMAYSTSPGAGAGIDWDGSRARVFASSDPGVARPDLVFTVNDNNAMTIKTSGTVGIGTTSPNTNYSTKLDVNGSIHWGTATYRGFLIAGQGAIELGGAGATPYIDFSNDDSDTSVNDYDVRLILENDDLLRVKGGDICTEAGKCLSASAAGLRIGPAGCNFVVTTSPFCYTLGCEACTGAGCQSQYLSCAGVCGGGAPPPGYTCPTTPLP